MARREAEGERWLDFLLGSGLMDWREAILRIHPSPAEIREAGGDIELALERKIAALARADAD